MRLSADSLHRSAGVGDLLPPPAERRSSEAFCDSCGAHVRELVAVGVKARETGEERVLALCLRCVTGDNRTWRLRWEQV